MYGVAQVNTIYFEFYNYTGNFSNIAYKCCVLVTSDVFVLNFMLQLSDKFLLVYQIDIL